MTNLFTDPSATNQETPVDVVDNALEVLVGDGKKFRDVESLARGKLESDRHIVQVQGEAKNLRDRVKDLEDQLREKKTMEDFLDEFRRDPTKETDDLGTPPNTSTPTAPRHQNQEQDLDAVIEAKLEEKRRRDEAVANVRSVEQKLSEVWGASYRDKLRSVANDLGLSYEFLGGIAEKSPKAFLDLVGATKPAPASDPNEGLPPRTHMQSGLNLQPSGVRNRVYYDKLKKQDVKLYRSEKIQAQMHRDAQRLGEAFFN